MHDSRPGGTPGEDTLVSIVVAAYNEERVIGECLTSLLHQDYRPLEIIVVDDGSKDSTPDIVAAFGDVLLLKQAKHVGAGAARNLGAAHGRGDILVFVDADMVFPRHFIEKLIAPIVLDGAIGTFTKEIFVANPERRWARAHQIARGLPVHCHFRDGFPERWETFRAIRRSHFEAVGGFDEIGHGEDVTLGRKLRELAHAAPGADCRHYEPETLRDVFLSARWYGRGERVLELERPRRRYGPAKSLVRGVRLATRHQMPSLLLYRLVWDAGVLVGLWTRGRSSSAK